MAPERGACPSVLPPFGPERGACPSVLRGVLVATVVPLMIVPKVVLVALKLVPANVLKLCVSSFFLKK